MILEIHQCLSEVYTKAEEIYHYLKELRTVSCHTYKGHFIRLNGVYAYQNYPLPVINIEGIGDIGVNLDKIWLEYFVDREEAVAIDYRQLIYLSKFYRVEVYGGVDCSYDFYQYGDGQGEIKRKIVVSGEQRIGIALYIDKKQRVENIISIFDQVSRIVKGEQVIKWLED